MSSEVFRILRDSQTIEYIFSPEYKLSMTEVKVAQGLENSNILCGEKASHNGREKLIYNISNMVSLSNLLTMSDDVTINNLIAKIPLIAGEAEKTGFLYGNHLDFCPDRIFVDEAKKYIFMIYLPVDYGSCESWEWKYQKLLNEINALNPSIKKSVQEVGKESNIETLSVLEKEQPKAKEGIISRIFGDKQKTKNKKSKTVKAARNARPGKEKQIEDENSGGTELLDSIFIPSIVITGLNISNKIETIITKEEFIIGKNPECCDFVIDFNKAISNKHCCIICKDGINYLTDLKSTNGTFLNGVRIGANEEKQIKVGDKFKLANIEFIVKSV